MEDDRPSAAQVDLDEAEEDALPDWSRFASFAKANRDKSEGAVLVPFIPKRGEKDFEPLAASDAFPPSSNEATLSAHQQHLLLSSRNALYTALSSGSRHHSSRAHNSFTWRPELDGGRATCDAGTAAYGIHFGNIGQFHVARRQLELVPEEALYMVERGAVELWREGDEGQRVPMSVQQAWDECIGHAELTPERYQVYAFLRRLGYVVTRARPIPGTERKPAPVKPAPLYRTLLDALVVPFLSAQALVHSLVRRLVALVKGRKGGSAPKRLRLGTTRRVGSQEGRYDYLAAGGRWTTYDKIFSRLQIIPSGHDRPLPRGPLPHAPSVFTPLAPVPTAAQAPDLPDLELHPYQPFFHVYKPVTKYKKSAPPPPDFKLVVINGATTPMPDLFEFTAMFDSCPMPAPSRGPSSVPPRPGPSAAASAGKPARANSRPTPSPAAGPSGTPPSPRRSRLTMLLSSVPLLPRLFPSLSASASSAPTSTPTHGRGAPRKPSPYPRLKTGRRTILVAVVDHGTSSLLRFSEAEFAKLPWAGGPRGC
ncbi:tRNA splicing endonuclease subunit SEN54 [Rhodotorula paludigena]|uniref:tRNA splicing endonuclease subunit SEN54 n=1 Tax=Rhodotorula paludigena TaxID=86838 RepID=UPI00317593AD